MEYSFERYLREKAEVPSTQVPDIMELVDIHEIKEGETLLKAGQVCQHIFYVEKGLLRLYLFKEDGNEYTIQFAPESWLTGDRDSFYLNEPSKYHIAAIEDTRVVFLDKDFSKKASDISASFRDYNVFLLQNHVRQLQKRISLLISASAEERYLDFVETYPDMLLRAPQWMIASYLGITPQGLSRVRKELAKRNFKPR